MTIDTHTHRGELIHLNDLDRPALPVDFPDYRDLMVVDREGQNLGRIADVLISPEDRKPLLVVVLFGGFLDMGAKHVLIPFEWLHDANAETVQANLIRAQAEAVPDYDPHGTKDFEPYFEYWFPEDVSPAPLPPNVQETTPEGHRPLLRIAQANAWQIPEGVQDLRGREVVDANNNSIGVIDDWFLNLARHIPEIVVIRRGGLFGAFGRETMVPYERLEPLDDQRFRVRVTPEELEGAPELKDEIYDYRPFFEYWKL